MNGLSKEFFEKKRKKFKMSDKLKNEVIAPFNWSEQVLSGEKKVIMTLVGEEKPSKKKL